MSKQLGNSPDPIELMDKYGADGVRMGMMLAAPAGNDIHFDEVLCEQGRNFNNKIWNAFRLVNGLELVNDDEHSVLKSIDVHKWFEKLIEEISIEINDLFSKYRLSEALTLIYKLFWDDFCSWYLEILKPEYGKPIGVFDHSQILVNFKELLKLLHPFMPFITEEIFQHIDKIVNLDYEENSSIMFSELINYEENPFRTKEYINENKNIISNFEKTKEIITNIRNIRQQKNISPKEKLNLQVLACRDAARHVSTECAGVIKKLANVEIEEVSEKATGAVSFLVGTTEYAVPIGNLINTEEEIAKMEEEIKYLQGFLKSVEAKLGNEKFVANAKPEIVENERKKKADAESKMETLKANINTLKK